MRLSRALGVPLSRLHGREPRTYSHTRPDGLTITTRESEWSDEDRLLLLALNAWEADLCPCGCGQRMSESLIDANVPAADRPQWSAGYFECGAGLALAQAQAEQAKTDETIEKTTKRRVPTSQRLWQVGQRSGSPPEPNT